MQAPIHPEYTDHLIGAPVRRNWPLMLLLPVGITAAIAGASFIVLIIGMLSM